MRHLPHTRLIRNLRLGVKSLLQHKLRSALTMLGVVFGVASVISMLAIGEGSKEQALNQIREMGASNIILNSIKPDLDVNASQQSPRDATQFGLLYEDELRIRQTIPMVKRTVPIRHLNKTARLSDISKLLRIVGTTPQWFNLIQREIVAGRSFDDHDEMKMANVCVLSEIAARELLATEHTIGQTIRIDDQIFEVIGIVQTRQSSRTPDKNNDVYIPINVCRARFGEMILEINQGQFKAEQIDLHQIIVEITTIEEVELAAQAIRLLVRKFHENDDYEIVVPLDLLHEAEESKKIWNRVLLSIASISLVVGGIGIMNIMLASVTERTKEIGIRRAIGAKRIQIIGQFLIETVVLSTSGGVLGVVLGCSIAWGLRIDYFEFDIDPIIPLYGVVLSFVISILTGIVFGIYPAMRAAYLDPIEALRQ